MVEVHLSFQGTKAESGSSSSLWTVPRTRGHLLTDQLLLMVATLHQMDQDPGRNPNRSHRYHQMIDRHLQDRPEA